MNIIFVGNKRIYKRGEKVKCLNCDKEMDNKSYCKMEEFYHCGDKEIYYQKVEHKKFVCKSCKIIYLDDEWKIPEKYNPTEKQKKTILFINNHLGMDIQPLTKHQCWLDIGKYFERAKKTPLYDDQCCIEMQEYYGMDASDFC